MKFRHWLFFLALVGLAVIIIVNAGQLNSFLHILGSLRWYAVVVIILLQVTSYYANARFYASFFRVFGHQLSIKRLYQAALAVNFVNYILPTAGLAGTGYLTQATHPEVPRGQATLAQLVRQAFSALGTLIILPAGFLFLFLANDVRHAWVKAILLLILLVLLVAFLIAWVIDHEDFSRRWAHRLGRRLHRLSKKLNPQAIERLLSEFYDGYHTIRGEWRQMLKPMGWSMVYIGLEILTLYASFVAFGVWPNPGMVIVAYTLANIISLAGGSLIGLGVFEAGMVGTLVALGSPFTLAFSVTIVYRALNMLVALPPGLYFYRKLL